MEDTIRKVLISLVLLIFIILINILIKKSLKKEISVDESYDFRIHYFKTDVAEDACIITYKDKYIMIDTGESVLKDDILLYLKENDINKLDYLIITHFDEDHVGSASYIVDSIEVENVLQSNIPTDKEVYHLYVSSLEKKGIIPKVVEGDYTFTLGDLNITIDGPEKIYENKASNNSSLITFINYKNTNYIFMGDAQNARLKDYLNKDLGEYDFIKLPYHGRYLKQLEPLLETINPRYALITNIKENGEVKSWLKKMKIKYLLTKNGNIDLYSNGTSIIVLQK